ncbi:RimK family protein [Halomonas sp. H5]|uniref:RimK family protein n=1 Tax=Halomonas sp. H5 TaxID=3423910 RepID=UPI003D35C36E
MHALRIVVDKLSDWSPYYPSDDLIAADDYLSRSPLDGESGTTRVLNLCGDLEYLGRGYYVSLLAQARGQRVLPTVETLNQLARKPLIDLELEGLEPLLNTLARQGALAGDVLRLRIMFGECEPPALARLARRLFERLPCPLLEAQLTSRQGQWRLTRLRPLRLTALHGDEQDRFAAALNRHSRRIWRTPRARRRYRFELAMLVDPQETLPPSNRGALKRFIRAGRRLGIDVSLITHRDRGRLAEFDGLFIRETTALDHPSYQLARRAEHEGLVVIDDSRSILRCTNKVYLHTLLEAKGIPAPQGHLLQRSERHRLAELASTLSYPRVLKVPDGAFSRGIVKIDGPEALQREAARLFESSALLLLQEWLPTDFDWRIGVLDGRPLFASRYYMARGHWQIYDHSAAKVRSGGFSTHAIEEVPAAVVRTALKATRLIGDGLYGVDLKQIGERVVVIEINDNPNIDAGIEDRVLGDRLYETLMGVFLARMETQRRRLG